MSPNRVCVLGADGLLGSKFVQLCKNKNIEYLEFGRKYRIDSAQHLDEIFENKFTHLINYAGYSNPRMCEAEPNKCWLANVLGVELILERLLERPTVRSLFLGSSKMGDDSAYGESKRTAFEMVAGYNQMHGLPCYVATQYSITGSNDENRWDGKIANYVERLREWLANKDVEHLYFDDEFAHYAVDGSAWDEMGEKVTFPKLKLFTTNFSRDWINLDDAVEAHLLALMYVDRHIEVGSGVVQTAHAYLERAFYPINWQDWVLAGNVGGGVDRPADIGWLIKQGWVPQMG